MHAPQVDAFILKGTVPRSFDTLFPLGHARGDGRHVCCHLACRITDVGVINRAACFRASKVQASVSTSQGQCSQLASPWQ
jgi:hypothetical protein